MSDDLTVQPIYRSTMERLESMRRTTPSGVDYWLAREIGPVLGYPTWREFESVIGRATQAATNAQLDPDKHFVLTHKMMGIGQGAVREGDDYFLSRAACYLIAMNGDPAKAEVAAAQAYFAVQTRKMEIEEQRAHDEKRLEAREKVTAAVKRVSGVAKAAGVRSDRQGIFHDQRWLGLYGKSAADVKNDKGLKANDNLFDRAGPLELSANEFQMNLAAEVIAREGIKTEAGAIARNLSVAKDVRGVMQRAGSTMPEKLPLEPDAISAVKRRLAPPKEKSKRVRGSKSKPSSEN